ncbi:PREDICTED: nucleotide-binding oligomerization domain-containing protein 2-like [Acropora digitifera]|uniref:nucleotide-binding oligomerization domain-containing protein 2-like n=1 Tax=Acropora digitifera TaxID=70779 RepID=UPI00077A8C02|nr:PREDICTED: nucleotide-binding oligomerization domain-containing protein 2-like [Acropora digitifera]
MASSPPDFASTQENTNYARLCRLLVDVGCTVLRDTFDSIHPPGNLHVVLSSPSVFSTLQSLRKKKVLNPLQWGKLFPAVASSVSSASFDVTLLMVLLRNICGLSPPVSTGSWDELPPDSDNSTEANVVRIKWYRNDVYGHATKASVDDATYSALWQKISSAVVALGSGYGAVISRLKTECMDPAAEAQYQQLLSDWKKDDDVVKEMLERTHAELEEIKERLHKTSNELGDMKEKTHDELGEIKEKQQKANNALAEMKEMIKQQQPLERGSKECLKDRQVSDPFDLVKCISIIRQLYEDREGWLAPFPWCEEFRFHLDNIFTRLKFVRRKKERGIITDVIVDLFQIFQPHQECSQPRRVLIEGQPGIGKTSYCQKIAYDWAKKRKRGESFPDVTFVLLLKCRDINFGLWEAIDDQLLPREVKEEDKERFFTFIREHQSKVLLVLDGLDELPRGQLSIYADIIQGRVLPESYILVTARSEVGVNVREYCHTLLEVEGFTKTDVKEFILKYFEEEHLAEKLLDKLDSDITLQELARNPLNTALLCLLCEEFDGKFPESRTLLYLEIVECVLRRYRQKIKSPETNEELVALYKVELKQLGFVAIEGLYNDSMYFDESAFNGFSRDVKSGLGFLSVEAGWSKRRPRRSYGFLHKSFQEFFAALCHCCQLLEGEICVENLIADCRYFEEFQQVLMFTSGLLAQKCEAAAKALIAGIATQVLEDSRLPVALACINECKRAGTTFDKEMAQFFGSHLKLQRANCDRLTKELAAVCIETLKTNSTVTALVLQHCNIDDAIAAELAGQLKENSTLTLLNLSSNAIGNEGADALAKGLKENSTLSSLNLSNNRITSDGVDALARGFKENSTLKKLLLVRNQIGHVGADVLAKELKENSMLTSLCLGANNIGDVVKKPIKVKHIMQAAKKNLTTLATIANQNQGKVSGLTGTD